MASDAPAPASISDLVLLATRLVTEMRSLLLAPSVTADFALSRAEDSIGAVERNLTLAGLIVAQQHATARARTALKGTK